MTDDTACEGPRARAERIYAALQTLRPDASRFDTDDVASITDAALAAFIQSLEVTKPCRTCSKPQRDYRYWKITVGGRLFMDAMRLAKGGE